MSRIREAAKAMNPIDDAFFQKMAEDIGFCEEVVQTILMDKTIRIIEHRPQLPLKNLQGRSAVLDLLCVKGGGKKVLVEVQKSDDDNHVRRVRYNSSLVTTNITDPGTKFENIEDIICIYISRSDFIKGGKVIYHVDRVVRETGTLLENGITEIYVNAQAKDDTEIGKLMEVFTESDKYYSDLFPRIAQRKQYFKDDKKGVEEMCAILEEVRLEGKVDALLSEGYSAEEIASKVKESVEKINEIIENLGED